MEVRQGWNTAMGRNKFDVTIEEADIARIFIEHDLPPERSSEVPAKLVFQVMEHTASLYAGAVHVRFYTAEGQHDQAQACVREIAEVKAKRDSILAEIRGVLGLAAVEAA
jgi:hypothetical protein